MTYQTTLAVPFNRESIEVFASLEKTHQLVMKFFPDLKGVGGGSDSLNDVFGAVYLVQLPTKPSLSPQVVLTINSILDIDGYNNVEVHSVNEGETVTFEVKLRTETRATRGFGEEKNHRTLPVKDDRLGEWADGLFSANGMEIQSLGASRYFQVGSHQGVRGFARDVQVTVVIKDADAANLAIHRGIGRGKAYGFGLLRRVDA